MFTNLIESDSHRKEFKRRTSFFLATIVAYAMVLFVAGIASIYAYDARLESLNNDITLLSWVPPVMPTAIDRPRATERARRTFPSNAQPDLTATRPERTVFVSSTSDPNRIPEFVGIKASDVPPIRDGAVLSNRNVDPPNLGPESLGNCVTCPATPPAFKVPEATKPPDPPVVKPKPQTLSTHILASRAISLPQPAYPPLAKQIHLEGSVPVQILVDEVGRVIPAHAVSGNAFFTKSAEEAALRARFTPTILNGQAVKVQGVITYNFRLQ